MHTSCPTSCRWRRPHPKATPRTTQTGPELVHLQTRLMAWLARAVRGALGVWGQPSLPCQPVGTRGHTACDSNGESTRSPAAHQWVGAGPCHECLRRSAEIISEMAVWWWGASVTIFLSSRIYWSAVLRLGAAFLLWSPLSRFADFRRFCSVVRFCGHSCQLVHGSAVAVGRRSSRERLFPPPDESGRSIAFWLRDD